MAKTRDDKFKLAFDSFIKDDIGVNEYKLKNLTKNKGECRHIYEFSVMRQIKQIGFIDRSGTTHIGEDVANMGMSTDTEILSEVYIPIKEDFEEKFNQVFEPYRDEITIGISNINGEPYKHYRSYVSIVSSETDENGITGKICVVYYKQHIPYNVIKDDDEYKKKYLMLLKRVESLESELSTALQDIDDLQDDMLYNERKVRLLKKVYTQERNTHKLCEANLSTKLREVFILSNKKEDCPICYEVLSDDKLVIPRCSHYICGECHSQCNECPICRTRYDDMS